MKSDSKLIKDALKQCFWSISKLSKDDDDDYFAWYAMKCASTVRQVMNDMSSVPLSIDKLAKHKAEIDKYQDDKEIAKQVTIEKGSDIKSDNSMMKVYEFLYRLQIRKDTKLHVNNLMQKNLDDEHSQEKERFINFRVASDDGTKFEYVYYLKNIFTYQLKFAQRSKLVTMDQLVQYNLFCEEGHIEILIDDILSVNTLPLTFNYNLYKPLEILLHEIEEFKNAAITLMEFCANALKEREYIAAVIDFHKDSTGRFKNRNDLASLFIKWDRYIAAYDDNELGLEHAEIFYKLHGEKHVSSKSKLVASYIDYAKRYIKAVEKGTFPHIK